jgi:hypothetical protein
MSESPNKNQNQQGQGKEGEKIQKEFDANLKKVEALLGGPKNTKFPTTVSNSVAAEIVNDLFAEEQKELEGKIRTDLRNLIKAKVSGDKEIKEAEGKLAALKLQKKKDYNQAANTIFKQIDNVGVILSDYTSALEAAGEKIDDNKQD